MKIEIHLLSQSLPIVYENVKNAYIKDGMYSVHTKDDFVHKHPLIYISRIIEMKEDEEKTEEMYDRVIELTDIIADELQKLKVNVEKWRIALKDESIIISFTWGPSIKYVFERFY